MNKILGIMIALLLFVDSNAQWSRTGGPEGISMSSLASVDGKIYAGTVTDGIYISYDDGLNWVAGNSGIENMEVTDIKSIPGFLVAGTFGNGVFHSSDNGQSWLPPNDHNNLFVVSLAVKDSFIFAGTISDGVYRSSDNGATWTQIIVLDVLSLGATENKVFAAAYGYTYVTTDNGETWSYANGLAGAAPWSFYVEGDTVFAGAVNKVYRSTNEGNTFTAIDLGVSYSITNVYSITGIGSDIFAATSYYGVLKSTDFGSTWSPAHNGMGPKDSRALTFNGSTLIAGTHYSGVYRSTDLGSAWSKSMTGFPAGSSITSMLAAGNALYTGTRDGVYRTTDNGLNWIKLSGVNDTINYGTFRGLCEKDEVIYAGGTLQFNSTVYKSTDRGTTWTRSGNGLPSDLTFINAMASSGNNILAATDVGIFYSSDDGNNWYQSNMPADFIEDMAASGGHVYAILQFVGIYRSDDDGVSWYLILPAVADHISMSAYNSHVYVGSFFEACIYSPNYGSSWFSSSGFPNETAVFGFGVVDDNTVLAGTDVTSAYVYISTDGGSYFSPYSQGLGPNAVAEFFAIGDTFMYAGTDYNGVWRRLKPGIVPVELVSFTAKVIDRKVNLYWQTASETNNKGFEIQRMNSQIKSSDRDWIKVGFVEGSGTASELHDYSFTDNENLSGSYKYRLKQIDYDGTSGYSDIIEIVVDDLVQFTLEQNYPNPFNPSTKIKYSVPRNEFVTLKVYDVLGNEVRTLVNGEQIPGNYEVTFNAEHLASGIYFYQLKAGTYNSIRKLILIK